MAEKTKRSRKERFCLAQDESCHWYLIPAIDRTRFYEMREKAEREDNHNEFINEFDGCRINGPHRLTFADPEELD